MIILDTDVLVGWLRGDRSARAAILAAAGDGLTTTLNAAELYEGVASSNRAQDEREPVEALLSSLRQVPFGPRAARAYGQVAAALRAKGKYPGLMDALVAAVAISEGATLVTRNRKHYELIGGVKLEAW